MSFSDSDVLNSKRYDCFISFHGQQRLSDLGFEGPGLGCTVRDLATKLPDRLRNIGGRNPSVFLYQQDITERFCDDIAKAMLQLRGGGVAFILLTRGYLSSEYCLAELRLFLHLAKLAKDDQRKDEAITIRIVCLDLSVETVKSALEDPVLEPFVSGLTQFQWQTVTHESTLEVVLSQICEHVLQHWRENRSICLGRDQYDCLDYLRTFFVPDSVYTHSVSRALGVRDVPQQDGQIISIFTHALRHNLLSGYHLNELIRAITVVDAKAAVRSYRRKWISDSWSWSTERGENDLQLFIQEAASALSKKQASAAALEVQSDIQSRRYAEAAYKLTSPDIPSCSVSSVVMPTKRIRIAVGEAYQPCRAILIDSSRIQSSWNNALLMSIPGWTHKFDFWAFETKEPGTIRIAVGHTSNPRCMMINQFLPQHEWNNGAVMTLDGWTHLMDFWAYEAARPGTVRIVVAEAWYPHRIVLRMVEPNMGQYMDLQGWRLKMVFWVYPSSK